MKADYFFYSGIICSVVFLSRAPTSHAISLFLL